MGSQIDSTKEEKLKSLLGQLEVECGILERIVYKNKNQHRRSSYFQYLLKVRRDLRLLKSANLDELLNSCFLVINGKRPKQKVHLLESLKRRKYEVGKPNFMERLLGAARLLSQIVEPMLRAATEVSTLLARSFFMGFSLTVLALLARLRVLVQQILLDIVSVFNTVCSLSQKKHSVKITHEEIEVYREIYPKKKDYVTLECVWDTDKFVLVERMNKCEIEMQERDNGGEVSVGDNAVLYKTIESFLGDDEPTTEKADAERLPYMKDSTNDLITAPLIEDEDNKQVGNFAEKLDTAVTTETPSKNVSQAHLLADTITSASSDGLKGTSNVRKVAFVSVKRPASSAANPTDLPWKAAPSTMNPTGLPSKETGSKGGDNTDAFYRLLTRGNLKDSLF
ncbi:uncharacterized protein LOC111275697 [Durio zibethinus]|uniref:Uncharacterized protein LOC111275697 n=1 Tax=Durio zibethinus TaxID=66656 RepID=A0A6P5WM27_DURZI|nr:uncharacterized protein LOC111275697 [Durio zibethinus]